MLRLLLGFVGGIYVGTYYNCKPIVEKVSDNQFENNRYMLIVLFILIGVVILLVILSFLNKGPKTVYLKPKAEPQSSVDKKEEKDNQNNNNQATLETRNLQSKTSEDVVDVGQTSAYDDDSVIQSDLKTIKQSAVKMSVGQKQGASQIVKDWLDDGNEASDDANPKQDEETEE